MLKSSVLILTAFVACDPASQAPVRAADPVSKPNTALKLDMHRWRVIQSQSGPKDYYSVVNGPGRVFIRGHYRPPEETTVLGYKLDEATRARVRRVSWEWRAVQLPKGANVCVSGKSDSAANIYFTWRRGLRYYTLKYVWTTLGKKGTVCDRKRNLFVAQDVIVLEAGQPVGKWEAEHVDLDAAFRSHFEGGDPKASVPTFLGIAIMTDGDQTHSQSIGDYADFVVELAAPH